MSFVGCKLALVHADAVLTYLRDDRPGLVWRNCWDLPGGGREGDETPVACVLRELSEEFGLTLPPARLLWQREYPSITDPSRPSHFFAGRLSPEDVAAIRFGDEGQHWQMMPLETFLNHRQSVPELQRRTAVALGELGWWQS